MDIPAGLAISDSEAEKLHAKWDTYGRVIASLTAQGFGAMNPPNYALPMYLDMDVLTAHNSTTILQELAKNKAWRDYTSQLKTYADMILTQTTNELSALEALSKKRIRETSKGKKGPTKDEIIEHARTNPRYEQLKVQEQEWQQYRDYYANEVSRLDSNYRIVSRAITVRGQDIEQGIRQGNVGAHGTGAAVPRDFP